MLLAAMSPAAIGATEFAVGFSDDELALIRSHGPWPPPPRRDPGNRWSGNPEAIALGARLFTDPRLATDAAMSCQTCHRSERAFTDGLALGIGWRRLERNTPTVLNLGYNRWFGWDGAADSLWAQSIRPILSPAEMNADARLIRSLYLEDDDYRRSLARLPADPATMDDDRILALTGKLLAAYQETLVTPRTAFDRFRDALLAGDLEAAVRYPAAAQRGLKLFTGRGRCSLCHFGPAFTSNEFENIGIPHMTTRGDVDRGRLEGMRKLKDSVFNLAGPFNDDASGSNGAHTRHLKFRHGAFGEFKVPGLRAVAATAPYMHNGSLATLEDVVRHYSDPDLERLHVDGGNLVGPLRFTDSEIADLVAFLKSLGDGSALSQTGQVVEQEQHHRNARQ